MANWDSYTQKTTPEDADSIMIKDDAANVNKRALFSGIWTWIVKKLNDTSISQLKTTQKTVIKAVNEIHDDLEITQGNATVNPTYITDGNCVYWKSGKIVTFRCTGTISFTNLPKGSWTEVITGLPATPQQNIAVNLDVLTEDNVYGVSAVFMNGTINLNKSRAFNGTYYGYISGSYVCN